MKDKITDAVITKLPQGVGTLAMREQHSRTKVMILATSEDFTIGKDNGIPWDCTSDMKFFKRVTTGNVVIMGRKTFESMGSRPLPNRVNIIVSGTLNPNDSVGDLIIVDNLASAFRIAQDVRLVHLKRNTVHEHVFIIGGVEIYEACLKDTDELLQSTIAVNCGEDGYGSDFVAGALARKFLYENEYVTEVIYCNKDGVVSTGDADKLLKITHHYKHDAPTMLMLKKRIKL